MTADDASVLLLQCIESRQDYGSFVLGCTIFYRVLLKEQIKKTDVLLLAVDRATHRPTRYNYAKWYDVSFRNAGQSQLLGH